MYHSYIFKHQLKHNLIGTIYYIELKKQYYNFFI